MFCGAATTDVYNKFLSRGLEVLPRGLWSCALSYIVVVLGLGEPPPYGRSDADERRVLSQPRHCHRLGGAPVPGEGLEKGVVREKKKEEHGYFP